MNAAQIITLANAATSPNARVLGICIGFAFIINKHPRPAHGIVWHDDALAETVYNSHYLLGKI